MNFIGGFVVFLVVVGVATAQQGYNYPASASNDLPVQTSYHPGNSYLPPPQQQQHNNGGYDYSPPTPPPAPLDEKNIYVHLPPDSAEQSLELPQQVGAPRKHYKIIFVKAPNPPKRPIPTPPPVEEKTLVYVLVKKPEGPSEEELRALTEQNTLKPSKPEVFFINYKTKKEKLPTPGPYGEGAIDVRGSFDGSDGSDDLSTGTFSGFGSLKNFGSSSEVFQSQGNFLPEGKAFDDSVSGFGSSDAFSLSTALSPPPPTLQTPAGLYGGPNFRH